MSLSLISCKTKYVEQEVPVYVTKTEYQNVFKYDSVYIHDSIDRYISDGVEVVVKFRDRYKLQLVHDTIATHDTIPVPVTKTVTKIVEKENPLNTWLLVFGIIGIVCVVFKIKSLI